MTFFDFTSDNKTNWEWRAYLSKDENTRLGLLENLNTGTEINVSEEQPITMFMANEQSIKRDRIELPFAADIIYWNSKLTYDDAGKPSCTCVIVSNNLKSYIEKLRLPIHKFYPVNLINAEKVSEQKRYYLFSLKGRIVDYTDYSKSIYRFVSITDRKIIKEEKGICNSFEEFSNIVNAELNNRTIVEFSNRFVKVDYDILWGFVNNLFISEKAKDMLSNPDIKGAKIKERQTEQITLVS